MKITINILPAIVSVIVLGISYSISMGYAQELVYFSGAANEAATMLVSFIMGAGLLFCSFEKVHK